MKIIAVIAHSVGLIGSGDSLPWHVKGDLVNFKKLTRGEVVICGSNTARGLPKLPDRYVVAISSKLDNTTNADFVVKTFREALEIAEQYNKGIVMVIGGAKLLDSVMDRLDGVVITEIKPELVTKSDNPVRLSEKFLMKVTDGNSCYVELDKTDEFVVSYVGFQGNQDLDYLLYGYCCDKLGIGGV